MRLYFRYFQSYPESGLSCSFLLVLLFLLAIPLLFGSASALPTDPSSATVIISSARANTSVTIPVAQQYIDSVSLFTNVTVSNGTISFDTVPLNTTSLDSINATPLALIASEHHHFSNKNTSQISIGFSLGLDQVNGAQVVVFRRSINGSWQQTPASVLRVQGEVASFIVTIPSFVDYYLIGTREGQSSFSFAASGNATKASASLAQIPAGRITILFPHIFLKTIELASSAPSTGVTLSVSSMMLNAASLRGLAKDVRPLGLIGVNRNGTLSITGTTIVFVVNSSLSPAERIAVYVPNISQGVATQETTNGWAELAAQVVSSNPGEYVVRVSGKSIFSKYLIGVTSRPFVPGSALNSNLGTSGAGMSGSGSKKPVQSGSTVTTAPAAYNPSGSLLPVITITVISMLALVAAWFAFRAPRKHPAPHPQTVPAKADPKLEVWLIQGVGAGHSLESLRSNLIAKGWKPHQIDGQIESVRRKLQSTKQQSKL